MRMARHIPVRMQNKNPWQCGVGLSNLRQFWFFCGFFLANSYLARHICKVLLIVMQITNIAYYTKNTAVCKTACRNVLGDHIRLGKIPGRAVLQTEQMYIFCTILMRNPCLNRESSVSVGYNITVCLLNQEEIHIFSKNIHYYLPPPIFTVRNIVSPWFISTFLCLI
jgi:hypothetical protein